MSVRVHAIAKKINKPSKELIEILTERGYDITSASASIDNITAQSIIDEFSVAVPEDQSKEESSSSSENIQPEIKKETSQKAPIVKSKADLDQEKRDKEEAELAEKAKLEKEKPAAVSPPPPAAKAPSVPPPPSTRASAPPPPPSTAGKSAIPSPPPSSGADIKSSDQDQSSEDQRTS